MLVLCPRQGQGEHAHRKIDEAHLEDLHQIRFVYAFAKTDDDVDMLKFSTIRWRQTGGTATFYVRQRGPGDEYVLKGKLDAMDEWRLTDFIFKTDQEPSCVQLATVASQKRQHRTIVRAKPEGSKGSLGAHYQVEAQLRTSVHELEGAWRVHIGLTVGHATACSTRWMDVDPFQPRHTGRTAFHEVIGTRYQS